jgi:hypothetical protein
LLGQSSVHQAHLTWTSILLLLSYYYLNGGAEHGKKNTSFASDKYMEH